MSHNLKVEYSKLSNNDLINTIKSFPITQLAKQLGLNLHQYGNSLQGNCPRHTSKNKKCLSIKVDENYFNCFHCNEAGDNINLIKLAKSIDFNEAIAWAKDNLNLTDFLPKYTSNSTQPLPYSNNQPDNKSLLYEDVVNICKGKLFDPQGKDALDYLINDRCYNVDTIKKTELFVLDNIQSVKTELLKKYPDLSEEIEALPLRGLLSEKLFIWFPYRNRFGNITGLVKRIIKPYGTTLKQNGEENIRFDSTRGLKKTDLFNQHNIVGDATIIVEGYFDALYQYAAGITNITAAGQALLSKSHLEGLKEKNIKRVIIAFDNDGTGIANTEKAVKLLLSETNIIPYVIDPVLYSPHKDPDEYFRAKGLDDLKKIYNKAEDGVKWVTKNLLNSLNGGTCTNDEIIDNIFKLLLQRDAPLIEEEIFDLLSTEMQLKKSYLKKSFEQFKDRNSDFIVKNYVQKYYQTSTRYLPFIERSTSSYSYYDKQNDEIHLSVSKDILGNIMLSSGLELPDKYPVLKLVFNPKDFNKTDFEKEEINLFTPTKFMQLEKGDKFINPRIHFPTIYNLISNLCSDYRDRKHFLNWVAGILQTGEKQLTAWVFKGEPGAGKGLFFGQVLRPLLGENQVCQVNDDQLNSSFNGYLKNKLLIVFNEVARDNQTRNSVNSKLKEIITDSELMINEKNIRPYEITNFVNCLFFSNDSIPVLIEANDRRFNVIETGKALINYRWFIDVQPNIMEKIKIELPFFAEFLKYWKYDPIAAKTTINNETKNSLVSVSMSKYQEFAQRLKDGDEDFFNEYWNRNSSDCHIFMGDKALDPGELNDKRIIKSRALTIFKNIYAKSVTVHYLTKQLGLYGIKCKSKTTNGIKDYYYEW